MDTTEILSTMPVAVLVESYMRTREMIERDRAYNNKYMRAYSKGEGFKEYQRLYKMAKIRGVTMEELKANPELQKPLPRGRAAAKAKKCLGA